MSLDQGIESLKQDALDYAREATEYYEPSECDDNEDDEYDGDPAVKAATDNLVINQIISQGLAELSRIRFESVEDAIEQFGELCGRAAGATDDEPLDENGDAASNYCCGFETAFVASYNEAQAELLTD
jgi:hypothetical protein